MKCRTRLLGSKKKKKQRCTFGIEVNQHDEGNLVLFELCMHDVEDVPSVLRHVNQQSYQLTKKVVDCDRALRRE